MPREPRTVRRADLTPAQRRLVDAMCRAAANAANAAKRAA
jgi:hypothetical protein